MADSLRIRIAKWIAGSHLAQLATVSSRVDDSPGWYSVSGRPHDYDPGKVWELYNDALTAWRKNPIAWRIVAITTDYVLGDQIQLGSPHRNLSKFIDDFWNHPKNRVDQRLEAMSDELARSGDLFVTLFRNDQDGMSYVRFVTKDRIQKIETAENDWETEIAFYETQDTGGARKWLSPFHPQADESPAVMLHYAVNRPVGALLGEGDLTTMLPWLQRYSRMLEDRVRLHWAVRAFLWIVTVPTSKVAQKQEQYRTPPEAGSIVVKDETEKWEAVTPLLRGSDASHDMKSVRGMIDAGSGYPPHWRGEPADANLATATAMQAPTERHLLRRQKYFTFILQDILYQAYARAVKAGRRPKLATNDYTKLFTVAVPDISRSDNEALARSAKDLSQAMAALSSQVAGGKSKTLNRLILQSIFKYAGSPQPDHILDTIQDELEEAGADPLPEEGPAADEDIEAE